MTANRARRRSAIDPPLLNPFDRTALTANTLATERAERPPATAQITRSRKSDE
jgi:hypothetical protein